MFNGLVWFYTVLPGHDLGVAILALTVLIRLVMTPLLFRAQEAQKELALFQPEIKKIQDGLKHDKQAQGKALAEFYSKKGVNPFSGCLLILVQLPVLLALFSVFRTGLEEGSLQFLYNFVPNPGHLNPHSFFGLLDLSRGNLYLGVAAALTQYLQTKLTVVVPVPSGAERGGFADALRWQSNYVFPALILVWSYTLPAALTLYWTALNILGILQEIVVRWVASRKQKVVLK